MSGRSGRGGGKNLAEHKSLKPAAIEPADEVKSKGSAKSSAFGERGKKASERKKILMRLPISIRRPALVQAACPEGRDQSRRNANFKSQKKSTKQRARETHY